MRYIPCRRKVSLAAYTSCTLALNNGGWLIPLTLVFPLHYVRQVVAMIINIPVEYNMTLTEWWKNIQGLSLRNLSGLSRSIFGCMLHIGQYESLLLSGILSWFLSIIIKNVILVNYLLSVQMIVFRCFIFRTFEKESQFFLVIVKSVLSILPILEGRFWILTESLNNFLMHFHELLTFWYSVSILIMHFLITWRCLIWLT
jgi:hypothetical protein